MSKKEKIGVLGATVAVGLCTSVSIAEIISFELSGTVLSAESFDANSGIWEPVSQGQSWSLSLVLDTDTAISFGFPGLEMSYEFSGVSYDFRIGDVLVQEQNQMVVSTVRTGGANGLFEDSFNFSLFSETHLGISLGWIGPGSIAADNALPTADWINSIDVPMRNPFAFTTNGFATPDGPVGDLAFLYADTINIIPAPMSTAPFVAMGFIAMRRRRSPSAG